MKRQPTHFLIVALLILLLIVSGAFGIFDRSLVVRDVAGTNVEQLPLAWFAVFDRRESTSPHDGEYDLGPWAPSTDQATHHAAISEIRRQIREGRTYQVNHTSGWRLHSPATRWRSTRIWPPLRPAATDRSSTRADSRSHRLHPSCSSNGAMIASSPNR